jgi:plastocyanin
MRSFLVPAALAATALAACGGSSSTGTAAPAMAAAKPAAVTAAATSPRATVRIVDFAYKPKTLRVVVGARVTWRNADTTNHSVTFHHGGPKAIGNLRPGAHAVRAFPSTGRFTYVCAFHPSMHATVVVSR